MRLPSFIVSLVACSSLFHAVGAQELRTVTLPVVATDYALDPTTGNLAGVDPKKNELVVYGPEALKGTGAVKPTAKLTVGNRPASIVFKQTTKERMFIVGCLSDSHLYVIDAATLKQTAKIPVTGSDVSGLAVSQAPDDAVVYYNYGRGHDSAAGFVDLDKKIDLGLAFDDSMDCAISADGNYAYRRGPWSPSGFESLRKVAPKTPGGKPTFERVFYDHDSTSQYVPDTFGLYTAAGRKLYSKQLDKPIGELQMTPAAFFPDRPMIVGLSGDSLNNNYGSRNAQRSVKLAVASYNSFRNVVEQELPAEFTAETSRENLAGPGDADFKFVGARLRMFIDVSRDRIVLVRDSRAVAAPISGLKLPKEPLLMIEALSQEPIYLGRNNVVGLRTRDSSIKVELAGKPDGAELTSKGIEWTPDETQIGPQVVRLKLSGGGLEREHAIELQVERPNIEVPFAAVRIAVDPAAKSAAVWSQVTDEHRFHNPVSGATPPVPQLALLDLAAGKLLASKNMPFAPGAVAVDEHHVYVVQDRSGVLTLLSRGALAETRQIALDGPIAWLQTAPNVLVVGLQDGRRLKYALPDMKFVGELGSVVRSSMPRSGSPVPPAPTEEGWQLADGDIYDARFEKPVLLNSVGEIMRLGTAPNFSLRGDQSRHVPLPMHNLGRGEESVVVQLRIASPALSLALTRSLRHEQVPNAVHTNRTTDAWSLSAYPGAVPAQASKRVLLAKHVSGSEQMQPSPFGQAAAMVVAGDHIFCLFKSRVYRLPLAEFHAAQSGAGVLQFSRKQSAFVADGPTAKLTHVVGGGQAPVQFALAVPQPATRIDTATGEVTIDVAALEKSGLDAVFQTGAHSVASQWASPEQLDAYVQTHAKRFEEVAGRKPKGVPMALHINVTATDAVPNTARLEYEVLVDVPRQAVEEKLRTATADLRKLRIAQQSPLTERGESGSVAAAERIRKLEERITALEAQIGVLIRIIEGRR